MSDQRVLVCAPANAPQYVPGTVFDRECSFCHAPVMVAPAGQKLLGTDPDLRLICVKCMLHQIEGGNVTDIAVAPGVIEEIRSWLRRN